MKCSYCGSHFLETHEVAVAFMKTGCPGCGARSIEGRNGFTQVPTSGSMNSYLPNPITENSNLFRTVLDENNRLYYTKYDSYRERFIKYSATSGSTGYDGQGKFFDFSGSKITEQEFRSVALVVYA